MIFLVYFNASLRNNIPFPQVKRPKYLLQKGPDCIPDPFLVRPYLLIGLQIAINLIHFEIKTNSKHKHY